MQWRNKKFDRVPFSLQCPEWYAHSRRKIDKAHLHCWFRGVSCSPLAGWRDPQSSGVCTEAALSCCQKAGSSGLPWKCLRVRRQFYWSKMFRACKAPDYAVKTHTARVSGGKLKLHLFRAQGKVFTTQFNFRGLIKDQLMWVLCSEKIYPFQNLNHCLIQPQKII